MYFLSEQVSEYERKRMDASEVQQYVLFVSDERSAIQWVRRQLSQEPMTYKDLQPLYMKEAQRVWEKHEQPLEFRTSSTRTSWKTVTGHGASLTRRKKPIWSRFATER